MSVPAGSSPAFVRALALALLAYYSCSRAHRCTSESDSRVETARQCEQVTQITMANNDQAHDGSIKSREEWHSQIATTMSKYSASLSS